MKLTLESLVHLEGKLKARAPLPLQSLLRLGKGSPTRLKLAPEASHFVLKSSGPLGGIGRSLGGVLPGRHLLLQFRGQAPLGRLPVRDQAAQLVPLRRDRLEIPLQPVPLGGHLIPLLLG